MPTETHYCKTISSQPLSFFFQQGSSKTGKKLLILGESLSQKGWIESGRAFYTTTGKLVPTGKRLNEELLPLGLSLEESAFTEIAKCYIGKNRKALTICGPLCAEHLLAQMAHFKPSVVLSLGVVTRDVLEEMFKTELPMGEISEVKSGKKAYHVLPIYHPSPANPFGHAKNTAIIGRQKEKLKVLLS
jgi:uracil-DNA glycosylase family 4